MAALPGWRPRPPRVHPNRHSRRVPPGAPALPRGRAQVLHRTPDRARALRPTGGEAGAARAAPARSARYVFGAWPEPMAIFFGLASGALGSAIVSTPSLSSALR
jgi:hypothetical protein